MIACTYFPLSDFTKMEKKNIHYYLKLKGFYLLEDIRTAPFNHQVIITNGKMPHESANVVCLSTNPEERNRTDGKGN